MAPSGLSCAAGSRTPRDLVERHDPRRRPILAGRPPRVHHAAAGRRKTQRQRTLVAASGGRDRGLSRWPELQRWQRNIAIENEARAVQNQIRAVRAKSKPGRSPIRHNSPESGLLAYAASQFTNNDLGSDSSDGDALGPGRPARDATSDDPVQRAASTPAKPVFQLDRSLRDLHEGAVLAGHTDLVWERGVEL